MKNEKRREAALAEFVASDLYRLIYNSDMMSREAIECMWMQGFNAGLKAAMDILNEGVP